MPRFFFDVDDGHPKHDDEGTECVDKHAAVIEAKRLLPDILRDKVQKQGDKQIITVVVMDEGGLSVYSASLCFVGTWLVR